MWGFILFWISRQIADLIFVLVVVFILAASVAGFLYITRDRENRP